MPISGIVHKNDCSQAVKLDRNDPERYAYCDVGMSYLNREKLRLRQISRAKSLLAFLKQQQGK